jgi:hypothetical protein
VKLGVLGTGDVARKRPPQLGAKQATRSCSGRATQPRRPSTSPFAASRKRSPRATSSSTRRAARRPSTRSRRSAQTCSPARRSSTWPTPSACDALFDPFDGDAEVVALACDCVYVAVELADAHDAVEGRGVAVVVEDEVAVGRPVADVSAGGVVSFARPVERQLAGKRRGLLDAVVVAEGERQRQLSGEIACGGVFVEPRDEPRIAEGDADRRALRGAGVLVIGARVRGRGRRARLGGGCSLVAVLV